jgi:[acyl-carrier-protein] S-malonyltransferase
MPQIWEIVGGADKGGIMVRTGPATTDTQLPDRLSTGALVEEISLNKDRLNYKLLEGTGPAAGWVAIKITAKELAVRTDKKPKAAAASAAPAPSTAVGTNGDARLPIALLFPGQGSQYVKMLDGVKDKPSVKEMLAKAEGILGYDILQICLEGPAEKLEETRYCQPAMFLGGLAAVEKLRQENEEAVTRCSVMAGLSLGEYTALCAAGVFSFEDGLRLVKLRGEAMQEAATVGDQAMLSCAGLDKDQLQALCEKCAKAKGPGGVCQIANELFPRGFSIGGTKDAIEELKVEAEKAGALQAKLLKTSGAFHTPLMQPAQDKLSLALEEVLPRMKSPAHTVWMNASAEPMHPGSKPEDIVALLKKQLTNPVLWETSMKKVIDYGVTEFYEVGPMKQIKAMMKRISQDSWKKTTNVEV